MIGHTADRYDGVVQHITRRRLVGGGAALAAGGGGLAFLSDPTDAQVAIDSFAVPDASFEQETLDPRLDVTVAYKYDAGMAPVGELWFGLDVGGSEIASDDLITSAGMHDGETTLSGAIVAADAWTTADFDPEIGETVSRDLDVTLRFEVRETGGTVIVADEASDTATVSVAHPTQEQRTATVGGSGTIRAADE